MSYYLNIKWCGVLYSDVNACGGLCFHHAGLGGRGGGGGGRGGVRKKRLRPPLTPVLTAPTFPLFRWSLHTHPLGTRLQGRGEMSDVIWQTLAPLCLANARLTSAGGVCKESTPFLRATQGHIIASFPLKFDLPGISDVVVPRPDLFGSLRPTAFADLISNANWF